jgi:uncharacterized protein YbjT (DUF2867 family)
MNPVTNPATNAARVRLFLLRATADPMLPLTAAMMATENNRNITCVGSSEPIRNLRAVIGVDRSTDPTIVVVAQWSPSTVRDQSEREALATRSHIWRGDEFATRHPFLRVRDLSTTARQYQQGRHVMKIVVIGGTGLVGSKVVNELTEHGHDAVAASPSTGVNTVTGAGLAEVLAGASVVIDVSNSPSFSEDAATEFFRAATTNLLAAEARAGVVHHVALSVVGTQRLARQSGYFRAKLLQERLIGDGPIPYTIVHATQFFEFLRPIADSATVGDTVRLPPALIQPIASADVAEAVAIAAVGTPRNGNTAVAGPQQFRLPDLIRTALTARGDARQVIADPDAQYWGVDIDERTLVPGDGAATFDIRFEDWLLESAARG